MSNTKIREVDFGDALNLTLDHYYDLLKTQVGGLGSDEFLQLKLVADPLDLSDENYRYYSQYNLLQRSDLAIDPEPISGKIYIGAERLHEVYGKFLQKLRKYATRRDLTSEEQDELASIDLSIRREKEKAEEYFDLEFIKWERHCARTGTALGDHSAYFQWASRWGYSKEIEEIVKKIRALYFDKKTITDRQYTNPEDREIVDAEYDYELPEMRLRYPVRPDYEYDKEFSVEVLARLPYGSTALYDDRRAVTWNMSLPQIESGTAGAFTASFDRNSGESDSITTDWGVSGSAGYKFIKVKASASEHKSIAEEFKKGLKIGLSAKAAFKVGIAYPKWFRPSLFKSGYVKENPADFSEFFGDDGSLLYYPTHIIVVRGFNCTFESTQNWSYDFERKFKASAGGGFSFAGISFGASGSYSKHQKTHKVDQSSTMLEFSDDEDTLRFVGYTVKKTNVLKDTVVPVTDPGPEAKVLDGKELTKGFPEDNKASE